MYASAESAIRPDRRPTFLVRIALPAVAAVVVLAVLLGAVMLLAASQANQLAADRQQSLATTVIKESVVNVAHDQEAVTIWEDAVRKLLEPRLDFEWIDANLGVWLHSYYGHDQAYIVDPRGNAVYAMVGGYRVEPEHYGRDLRPTAARLIAELRAKLRKPSPGDVSASVRTPGAVDFALVGGHPSIVSIKPIVSDGEEPKQVPGEEFVHVSVRHLDGKFAATLAQQYQLEGAYFSRDGAASREQRAIPLKSSAGAVLAYLKWNPFGPGAMMIQRIAPAAIGAVLLILGMVAWLLRRIRQSTLQLEASQAQAQHLAFHDALTGLANRALFDDRLTLALGDAQRRGRAVALLYFDLDRFKNVNDTLGHPAGDQLICAMARRLVEVTRSTDIVARIGGDEFAVIQTNVGSPAEVEVLCMRVVEAVAEPFELAGSNVSVGVSIGIALSPYDALDRTELARKADIALYEAKSSGRGRYVFFAEAMDASIRTRQEIERDLRAALAAGDQFEVVYQPLYSAQSGRITGAEALVRWHHPLHGTMSPSTFIPIAEATGLVEPIGEWVLEEACTAAAGWPIHSVSVNVSAVQLRNERFAERVLAILARTGLDPARLELEITETSFLESAGSCQPRLAALRARGVQIALDDFGTGYSSFSHLRHFDVDRIKIDQSFVHGIDVRDGGSAIIQAIVDLAKASGMQVTAEGVETQEQSRFLAKAGCNMLQGYLMSSPLSAGKFGALFGAADRAVTQPAGAAPAGQIPRSAAVAVAAPRQAEALRSGRMR
jgi:diguanylate cyclase (GGDEF)-like protein